MSRFLPHPDPGHPAANPERIGVLLVNSGTPDSLSTRDVRRFLRNLLGDPRVVELPRALWLPLLHGVILRTRPSRSARKYRRIWTDRGSPLLLFAELFRSALERELAARVIAPMSVELGMLYSSPSVANGLRKLQASGAQRILVLPMFPQYCGASTGPVYDQVAHELRRWRRIPELRVIAEYPDFPGYIEALRASVAEHWAAHGRTQHLLISFHGIPERYFKEGDPYYCKCQKTARLLADELHLRDGEWSVAFQSKYGPGVWLKPYTDETLEKMPETGHRRVTVICPGFAVDCLETLDEIAIESKARFMQAGGHEFQYVPALNARADHARALADLVAQHCQGWAQADPSWLRSMVRANS
jgi:protoporphyrin/coproporphyrin ferrochelatase